MQKLNKIIVIATLCFLWSGISVSAQVYGNKDYLKLMQGAMREGDFRQAVLRGIEAVRFYSERGVSNEKLKAVVLLSEAYQSLGQYHKALAELKAAVDFTDATEDTDLLSSLAGKLGNAYILVNMLDEAEVQLKQAIDKADRAKDPAVKPALLNTIGNLYALKGRPGDAIRTYGDALDLLKTLDSPLLSSKVGLNQAGALIKAGKYREAESSLGAACAILGKLEASHDKAYGFINAAELYEKLALPAKEAKTAHMQQAADSFAKALNAAEMVGDHTALSYALGGMGRLAESQGSTEEALRLTHRALFEAQATGVPEALYLWQWQSGRLLKAQDIRASLYAFRAAVDTLQSIRREFSGDCKLYNGLSFQDYVEPIYLGLADILLKLYDSAPDRTTEEAYLIEVVRTIELLKGAELQDYFQNSCVVEERKDIINEKTALVYYVPFPERLEIIVGYPGGIRKFSSPIGKEELSAQVRQFRLKLEKRTTREYMPLAQSLYDKLIRPFEGELSSGGVDTIVFVPEGSLRTIPMSAVHNGRDFLIKNFAVAEIPALSFTSPHHFAMEKGDLLLTALSEAVQGFSPLANVPLELKAVGELYKKKSLLLNGDFRVPAMQKAMEEKPYSVVHIASHGEFSENADETYILTWDGRLSMDQMERFIRMNRFRKNSVELLTLSACQSAAGNDRAALGLAGLSVKAGAKSALATLWYINDQASSELVAEFYRQLMENGLSYAKALQRSQLQLQEDSRYRHPSYWAPFLLIGNWM